VLVTGCSSGIGRATALLLAERGYRVLAGVRDSEHVAELTRPDLTLLEPLVLDVTKEDHIGPKKTTLLVPLSLFAKPVPRGSTAWSTMPG